MGFLSLQPDRQANLVALKCKPGAISRRFYSEINRDLGATHWNTITLNSSFATAQAQHFVLHSSQSSFSFLTFKVSISLVTIIREKKNKYE